MKVLPVIRFSLEPSSTATASNAGPKLLPRMVVCWDAMQCWPHVISHGADRPDQVQVGLGRPELRRPIDVQPDEVALNKGAARIARLSPAIDRHRPEEDGICRRWLHGVHPRSGDVEGDGAGNRTGLGGYERLA
jgi:hypothetical protein